MAHSLTVDVVKAVADVNGDDPSNLDYVLEDYIDTDALDRLAARDAADWTLSFALPGHEVTVTSDGRIVVDDSEVRDLAMGDYRSSPHAAD